MHHGIKAVSVSAEIKENDAIASGHGIKLTDSNTTEKMISCWD